MPAHYSSADHRIVEAVKWDPPKPAERINDFIAMSKGTSNGYVVTSDAGDVVINTGRANEGRRYRERFEQLLGRPLKVAKIIYTQSHPDHVGGWEFFADEGSETIVQRNFLPILRDRHLLNAFFVDRAPRVLHAILPPAGTPMHPRTAPEPENPTAFIDDYAFELGGRRFELYSAPSGETLDSLMVWLPREKIVFTGNWMGALYGAWPNFYTLRGDRDRSIPGFMRELERLIAWEPEIMITGHAEPIVGKERIRKDMTKLLEAVRHIHTETIRGMNALKTLPTMMQEIKLPLELERAPGRGPIHWYVRAIYEEYTGWFRHERTTELYPEPPQAIWSELTAMAGGPDALVERAMRRLEAGQPVEALHFLEIAIEAEPRHAGARRAEISALTELINRGKGHAADEQCWLEYKIGEADAVLAAAAPTS